MWCIYAFHDPQTLAVSVLQLLKNKLKNSGTYYSDVRVYYKKLYTNKNNLTTYHENYPPDIHSNIAAA